MDIRKEKTIKRIKDGFRELVKTKNYSDIKVQDILDISEVGRTTFYEHYKSKNQVLEEIINDIFIHISKPKEDNIGDNNLLHIITHMLRHFMMDKEFLKAILKRDSHDIFIEALFNQLNTLINNRMMPYYESIYVPENVLLHHLSSSLMEIILWWLKDDDCNTKTEDIAYYYFSLVMPALKTKDFDYTISDKVKELKI